MATPALAGICCAICSLAQDYAILGIKIRHLQKAQATRRIIYVLRKARSAGLSKGLLAWAVWVTNDKHAKKVY